MNITDRIFLFIAIGHSQRHGFIDHHADASALSPSLPETTPLKLDLIS